MKQSKENKMGTKSILPLIIEMSLPPLCSMFLQFTYNFVDCMFVAQISEDALTAVSLSFPLTTLMLAFSIGVGVGINVLIARNLGKNDVEEANSVVTHGLLLSLFFGLFLSFAFYAILRPYFSLYIQDKEILSLAMQYMNICIFIQLPNMLHIAVQKILQGTGNMLAPMGFQIAGVVLNFILDPILIWGYGPFPKMGIQGAAVSTVLGYTLSMLIAFYMLLFTKQKVKIKVKGFHFHIGVWKEIFKCGIPSFIMNALGAFMVTFTNAFLVAYSTTAVAFFGAYFKAQQMVVMTVNGLIQGCIPIMSFNYGAGNEKRLKKTFRYGTVIAVILMLTGEVILTLFPSQILKIFMASEEMLELGIPALRIMATSYVFNGVATMAASYMQSINKIRESIFINIMRQCVGLFPVMWILTKMLGMVGVWLAFPCAEILSCICCGWLLWRYERKKAVS